KRTFMSIPCNRSIAATFKMQVKAWQRSAWGDCPGRYEPLVRPQGHHSESWGGQALRTRFVWWTALPMLVTIPAVVNAQAASPSSAAPATPPAAVSADQVIEFSADSVAYDSEADTVTATGDVRMNREGNYLAANQ